MHLQCKQRPGLVGPSRQLPPTQACVSTNPKGCYKGIKTDFVPDSKHVIIIPEVVYFN